jgi:hypothetical protein
MLATTVFPDKAKRFRHKMADGNGQTNPLPKMSWSNPRQHTVGTRSIGRETAQGSE